jgi:hypothetical protein
MINIIGWASVFTLLFVYLKGTHRQYAWANLILCIPCCLPALVHGVYPSVFISLAFGLIAIKHIKEKK